MNIHIELKLTLLSWISNIHWAKQCHYHNCFTAIIDKWIILRISGSYLHVHVRAHYTLHNIVTLKAGSQYDVGATSVLSVMSFTGKAIFFTSNNSIPDNKFFKKLIGWMLANTGNWHTAGIKVKFIPASPRCLRCYAGASIILWYRHYSDARIKYIHTVLCLMTQWTAVQE